MTMTIDILKHINFLPLTYPISALFATFSISRSRIIHINIIRISHTSFSAQSLASANIRPRKRDSLRPLK